MVALTLLNITLGSVCTVPILADCVFVYFTVLG